MATAQQWDVFCRVIDNHGDLGVCWRLVNQLAECGCTCRLWVDDASALAWMAPGLVMGAAAAPIAGRVQVAAFDEAATATPGSVVVEAFGCDPPSAFIAAMRRTRPPVWVNLEYLSAQPYVERNHGLPSPQLSGPGAGLVKWFYYPGFTPSTGGLLREEGPLHNPSPISARGIAHPVRQVALPSALNNERRVFVFAYAHARLEALLDALNVQPTLVLAAQGPSQDLLRSLFDAEGRRGHLRLHGLPWLAQPAFDAVLQACDLNIVRGEDSLVQALWAGKPFVWNLYAQDDGVHVGKLQALLDRMLEGAPHDVAHTVRHIHGVINGLPVGDALLPSLTFGALDAWQRAIAPWLAGLRAQGDLVTRLCDFVAAHQDPPGGAGDAG